MTEVELAMESLAKDNADEPERREALETDVKLLNEELDRRTQHAQRTLDAVQADTIEKTAEAEQQLSALTEQHAAVVVRAQALQQQLELAQQAQQGEARGLSEALEVASGRIAELEREKSIAGEGVDAAEREVKLQRSVVRELQAELSTSTAALRAEMAAISEQQARSVEDHRRTEEALRAQLVAAEEALTQRSSQLEALRTQLAAAAEETTALQQRPRSAAAGATRADGSSC